MRQWICLLFLLPCWLNAQPMNFEDYPVYQGSDLGVHWTPERTVFRIWSPAAEQVWLRIYEAGQGGEATLQQELERGEQGSWQTVLEGDFENQYYTLQIQSEGQWLQETLDPYARAVGVNGKRGMIINLDATDPEGWALDQGPRLDPENIVLYELHLRDLSTHFSSGIKEKGKFLGLAQAYTLSPDGLTTGLDHLTELGITHVHLLPSFDFRSIDETRLEENNFNWGYDPQHYNVPEGSYSTNPFDGRTRIREFKQMVKALHDRRIGLVMDVVYNHTGATETSVFNQIAPGYFYRFSEDGSFSNGSACGNEVASERSMVRKFIVESVTYWAKEYHVDGFRFDLMGLHDIETMNAVREALNAIDPSIFVYGEGWTADSTPLPSEQLALKAHTAQLGGVATFSDDLRDALKGHVFTPTDRGFVSGAAGLKESLKFGIAGSVYHPEINYSEVRYSKEAWAAHPLQTISYVSCHDNLSLWDKLAVSIPDALEEEREKMHQLALSVVLTAQGVPFLHAGSEFMRTKGGEENSYQSPDSVNQLDWRRKHDYLETFDFVRALIRLRKQHPAFRLKTGAEVRQYLRFLPTRSDHLVAFHLDGASVGDPWDEIVVAYNGGEKPANLIVEKKNWQVALLGTKIDPNGINSFTANNLLVPAREAVILFSESEKSAPIIKDGK